MRAEKPHRLYPPLVAAPRQRNTHRTLTRMHHPHRGCPISRVLCEKWGFAADGAPPRHGRTTPAVTCKSGASAPRKGSKSCRASAPAVARTGGPQRLVHLSQTMEQLSPLRHGRARIGSDQQTSESRTTPAPDPGSYVARVRTDAFVRSAGAARALLLCSTASMTHIGRESAYTQCQSGCPRLLREVGLSPLDAGKSTRHRTPCGAGCNVPKTATSEAAHFVVADENSNAVCGPAPRNTL